MGGVARSDKRGERLIFHTVFASLIRSSCSSRVNTYTCVRVWLRHVLRGD